MMTMIPGCIVLGRCGTDRDYLPVASLDARREASIRA